jgi:hypothetical protein
MAALLEKLPAGGFVVVVPDFGDLTSGSNWPSMRMLSSVPSLVIKSCRYLLNCCSTEVMLKLNVDMEVSSNSGELANLFKYDGLF